MASRLDHLKLRLRDRRHSALLAATVASIAVRPVVGDARAAPMLFSLALLVLLVIALYNIQADEMAGDRAALLRERRLQRGIGWSLALLALAERILVLITGSQRLFFLGSISWLAFLVFVTWHELRSILRQRRVTGETISMCVTVYLLIGICWALLYAILLQIDPHAFDLGDHVAPSAGLPTLSHAIPVLLFFSLSTLATIGSGDIVPASLLAEYASVAEGIVGQFYLAVLVARMVGMQMSAAPPPETEDGAPRRGLRGAEQVEGGAPSSYEVTSPGE